DPIMNSVSHSRMRSLLGRVPSSPMVPVTHGRSSGSTAFPSNALAHPAPSLSATAITSSVAYIAPAPTSIAILLPALSTSAALEIVFRRNDPRIRKPYTRDHRIVSVRRMRHCIHLGHILWNDHARHRPRRHRDAHSAIDHMTGSRRIYQAVAVLARDILEQGVEIHFLLITATERHRRRLSDDREHVLMIHLRVIQTVEEMDRTRSRCCKTYSQLARELRVRRRHERGLLLMSYLNEVQLAVCPIYRRNESVDPIAGVTVNSPNSPGDQTLHDEVARGCTHICLSVCLTVVPIAESVDTG